MIREAMQFFRDLVRDGFETFEVENATFVRNEHGVEEVKPAVRRPAPLEFSTLAAFCSYINADPDEVSAGSLLVMVASGQVHLMSPLCGWDRRRDVFARATSLASLQRMPFDSWISREDMQLILATGFEPTEHRDLAADFCRKIRGDEVLEVDDDGVSQSVTASKGVASLTRNQLPQPLTLRPRRTFAEIDQPEAQFVFRLKHDKGSGFACKLVELQDGKWQEKARGDIAAYVCDHTGSGMVFA